MPSETPAMLQENIIPYYYAQLSIAFTYNSFDDISSFLTFRLHVTLSLTLEYPTS
jgi:hypothetical protein